VKRSNILITGATGNVGEELVKSLVKTNHSVIVGVRDIEKAKEKFADNLDFIDIINLDFTRPDTHKEALKGIKKVFLVRPPQISNVKKFIFPFIDKALEEKIEHVVFLSLLGVERNPVVPHYKIEKYLEKSSIGYTFLRASFFMQNLNTTHCQDIREYNEIFLPAGNGKTSFIDVRDIAEVAVKVLTEEGHMKEAYSLTGKEAMDYYQVAEAFTRVLGRKIEYTSPSIFKFYRRMRNRGMDRGYVLIMIALYITARLGLAKKTTNTLENLLDREPISVEQYVSDYKQSWL